MASPRAGATPDEIRERIDLAEIVAGYVSLKKAGRRLVGLCPFHEEKAPSFSVDPQKQVWHCFGCKEGGNVFHFLMKAEGLTFVEAAQKLAARAGLEFRARRDSEETRSEKEQLARTNAAAAEFFQRQLAGPAGEKARTYLAGRGLSEKAISDFGLGYAPGDWEALCRHLSSRGTSPAALARAGLAIARPSGDGCYDRFRDRVMFPILDLEERVAGFGGRTLDEKETAKYINSPETSLFRKGRLVYGLPYARKAIADRGRVLIVEGYMDVIACHEAGFREAVATMGTALTPQHLSLLRRYSQSLYTAFDADSAGLRATLRGRDLFEAAEVEVRVVRMPAGKDPDALVREAGPEALAAAVQAAVTLVDYELEAIAARHPEKGSETRLAVLREAIPVLAGLKRPMDRAHYAQRLAELWGHPDVTLVESLQKAILSELSRYRIAPRAEVAERVGWPERGLILTEREVLRAILAGEVAGSELTAECFEDAGHQRLFEVVIEMTGGGAPPDVHAVMGAVGAEGAGLVAGLAAEDPPTKEAAAKACARLEERRLQVRYRELERRIRAGELTRRDPEYAEFYALGRELSSQLGRRVTGEGPGVQNR
jgi:DNA primase